MKRFTDTDIWKKQWFQDLTPKYKMAWFYLKDNCDNVGVWNVNFRLADFQIGAKINWEEFRTKTNGNIYIISDKKWWIVDFCNFQYGQLSEKSNSKPIQSYIALLKKHSLWIGYAEGIHTFQDKEKDKEQVKDKEKDQDKEPPKHKYGEYKHVLLTDKQYETLPLKVDNRERWIKQLDEYLENHPKKSYANHNLTIQNWYRNDENKKPIPIPRYVPETITEEERKEADKLIEQAGGLTDMFGKVVEAKRFKK
jgi:hypothetical protein